MTVVIIKSLEAASVHMNCFIVMMLPGIIVCFIAI